MTRRLSRRARFHSIDGYVRRATQGLPRAERLDAAAELRAHLLERVTEHQAQGFSHEEAEFLAVKGMGEPAPVNRGLLGHALTYRLGWWVLAALVGIGGGWQLRQYALREWNPPAEGIKFEAANTADNNFLFTQADAPRGTYQAVTLTLPLGTEALVYAQVAGSRAHNGFSDLVLDSHDVAELTAQNIVGRVPGSYRHQERWLWMTERLRCNGQPAARIFLTGQSMASPFWNAAGSNRVGLLRLTDPCSGPMVHLPVLKQPGQLEGVPVSPDGADVVLTNERPEPLRMNQWTVLTRVVVDPKRRDGSSVSPARSPYSQQSTGVMLAVLPLRRSDLPKPSPNQPHPWVNLKGHEFALPAFPPIVPDDSVSVP